MLYGQLRAKESMLCTGYQSSNGLAGGRTGTPRSRNLLIIAITRGVAASTSLTSLADQSRSASESAPGQATRWMLLAFLSSPHMQASPPWMLQESTRKYLLMSVVSCELGRALEMVHKNKNNPTEIIGGDACDLCSGRVVPTS